MAYTIKPSDWISGTTNPSASTISFTAVGLGLADADIDVTTGDFRKILLALLVKTNAYHFATVAADRLTTMIPSVATSGQTTSAIVQFSGSPGQVTLNAAP